MTETISLPAWIFYLLLLFSAVMVLDRILVPSLRWYLRRRVKEVMEEVSSRLQIEIRPFQLTRRQGLIDRLVFDEQVIEATRHFAETEDIPMTVAQEKVKRYASEIVPAFNAYIYFRFGYWLARKTARLIYRVRVGFFDDDTMKNIPRDASVVFVMNHRSNLDYILVSFLVAERTALSYAVGEWAKVWPLQTLIRSMGAFFVRRNSGNDLYRKVLERYVHLSTRAGVCQAVFPEGGLTRDGAMREPRLGFLDYMLRGYHHEQDKDVVFIPVGINYDRVIEDRSLLRSLHPEKEKRSLWFVIKTTSNFFFKTIRLSRKTRWSRFGYASVNFGKPVSTRDYCRAQNIDFSQLQGEARFDRIHDLARLLMKEVAGVVPILPVALTAEVLLETLHHPQSELQVKSSVVARIDELRNTDAPINIAPAAYDGVISHALNMLFGRGIILLKDGLVQVEESAVEVLSYYANSISQWKNAEQAETMTV